MGPPGDEKVKLMVKLAVSIHQRDKQTDTARQQRPRYILVASRGKHLSIQSLCCFNSLFLLYSTHKRLFGLIHRSKD